ncbi:MAG: NUDIX hydrolase [Desulfuromonadales bacterium]|nr:NUDIX hydrolase [Desulfuromonadales bacterium]
MSQEPRHTVVVGCLVRNEGGQVLLIRHHRRGWEIPQGRLEEGEELVAAAHREVLEETGVTIELGPLAAVHSKVSPPSALIFTFLARHLAGEPRGCAECPEAGWFEVEEALQKVENPVNRDRLRGLLDYAGKVVYCSYRTQPYTLHLKTILG